MRRFAYEIFSTFLIPNAPLQVPEISQPLIQNIDKVLRFVSSSTTADQLDQLKKLFIPARTRAVSQLNDLLKEFRPMRVRQQTIQQLANGLNVDMSHMNLNCHAKIDHLNELKAAEQILFRTLDSLLQIAGVTNAADLSADSAISTLDSRTLALIMSVSTIIKVNFFIIHCDFYHLIVLNYSLD